MGNMRKKWIVGRIDGITFARTPGVEALIIQWSEIDEHIRLLDHYQLLAYLWKFRGVVDFSKRELKVLSDNLLREELLSIDLREIEKKLRRLWKRALRSDTKIVKVE
jgi:hypothetical protein